MRDGVSEVGADGLVTLPSAVILLVHELLHLLQLLRQRKTWVRLDARWREQPSDALLRKVLHVAAIIAGPFVGRRLGIVVHRHKRQLINPGSNVALGVHVTTGRARAKGDAKNPVLDR